MQGFFVLYRSIFDVVRDFLQDEALVPTDRTLAKYLKPDLLIIDDMGMKQLPKRSGEYLFEIIMRRYEVRSTIMTSRRPRKNHQYEIPNSNILFSIRIITNSGLPMHSRRRRYLERLLSSIKSAGFPSQRIEIIIAGACNSLSLDVKILHHPELAEKGHVCALRNKAIAASRVEWIIQCDDDVLFTEGYFEQIRGDISKNTDILCTRLLNPNGMRYWDWAAYDPAKGQTLLPYAATSEYVFATGGHAIYRHAVFERLTWPETILHRGNEENALAAQARSIGIKFKINQRATVFLQYHHCDAEAVVRNRAQLNQNHECDQFKQALQASDLPLSAEKLSRSTVTLRLNNSWLFAPG